MTPTGQVRGYFPVLVETNLTARKLFMFTMYNFSLFRMSSSDPAQPGIMEAEVKLWFTRWLTETQVEDRPVDLIAAELMILEASLTLEDVQISEKFRKTVLSQFQAEAQIF